MKSTGVVALLLCGIAAQAAVAETAISAVERTIADEFSAQRRIRPIATRLEVFPSSRQIRRCVDWYAIEHRPSGEVLTPHMRCWWARR
jgi:hypothetical protein